jgi:flagellin-like protein
MKRNTEKKHYKMNNKGLSGVVATVILIAIVIAAVAIVWGVVTNLVSERLEEAGSCFNIFGKVNLENAYTCWNGDDNEFQFSINIADLEVDSIIVSILGEGQTKSYEITNTAQNIDGLKNYDDSTSIKLPGKNGGLTYIATGITSRPDSIRISPVVGGNQCEVADTIENIDSCSLLA